MATAVAIVIVSWNVRDLLRNCLRSVQSSVLSGDQTCEVWVVDNASSDGSADMVSAEFPSVKLLRIESNLGFARGNNLALSAMGFGQQHEFLQQTPPDFVFLLNPDTTIAPDTIRKLTEFLQLNPHAGGCGAQLSYGDGSFQHSAFHFPGLFQLFFDFFPLHQRLLNSRLNGRYSRSDYDGGEPFPVDFILGAAMMVRRVAIEAIGLLDESYFMYCEEVDWCWRFYDADWRFWCVPAARVTHFEGQSARQFREKMLIALWKSRLLLYARRYGFARRWFTHQLLRVGFRTEIRRVQAQRAQGLLSQNEAEQRIRTYQQIVGLISE